MGILVQSQLNGVVQGQTIIRGDGHGRIIGITNEGIGIEPSADAVEKYSSNGGFSLETFGDLELPQMVVGPLVEAGSFSVAATTWASYATAERHISRVAKATGVELKFPFDLRSLLVYVGYLLAAKESNGRGLKAKSVEKYVSALRLIQMRKGFFEPWVRPEIIKQILRGAANRDQLEKRMAGKKSKAAMTPDLMWNLKLALRRVKWRLGRRRICWAVATICWAGALRVHEALSRQTRKFDATSAMTAGDVEFSNAEVDKRKVDTLKMHLKHPKEQRLSEGVTIDIFASQDFMCPVEAFRKWKRDKEVRLDRNKPLFRLDSGENYTGAQFNKDIKTLLGGVVDYSKAPITSHSFRRGLATFMAQNGYEDAEIMKIGRQELNFSY